MYFSGFKILYWTSQTIKKTFSDRTYFHEWIYFVAIVNSPAAAQKIKFKK
jgi:hypothetical protein